MSRPRERMMQDIQLRRLLPPSQVSYARPIRQLALHYHISPDQITKEELRDYFLFQRNHCQWSAFAATITLCPIKFFYENTLVQTTTN
ncbi:MAG: phage integrase N-terminal SAM-like domain-containing protein [Phycisphaerales bacterium]|nr:MAG: phage integrase N-terminal SAM-like domain-containing protein [Phycisphaerales bacterium]